MATGKYAEVVKTLPRLPASDAGFQEKVASRKRELIDNDPLKMRSASALASEYRRLRDSKEEVEQVMSRLNLELEAIGQLLIQQYEADGTSSIALATGGSVSTQLEPYAQVTDRDACRQWAIAEGLERQLALPWQTANSLVKDRLLKGEPEPPGMKAFVRTKIVLRR
jgi:hypothetical protein